MLSALRRFAKTNLLLRNVSSSLVSNKISYNENIIVIIGRYFVTTGISCNKITKANGIEESILSSTSIGITATIAIEEQKERAKTFWNESNYDEEMKRKVHGDVIKNLNEGTVLPIFHTLCQPPDKRLFSPNTIVGKMDENCTDMIHLSSKNVTAGVSTAKKKRVDGVVSKQLERSYLPDFFKIGRASCRERVLNLV